MLLACWSSKGGAGTTVVAAALAVLLARRTPGGALLVDLAGDVPAALGLTDATGPGVAGWLQAGATVPPDALARLELPAIDGLAVLPRGDGPLIEARASVLSRLLLDDGRAVVVDCGTQPQGAALEVVTAATRSLLVTRACFLGLRRAMAGPVRPSEVVLLEEPGRALGPTDVERAVGARVISTVAFDPQVARAVDAGLLGHRLPRGLAKEVARAI